LTHFFSSATYYPPALLFFFWHVFSFLTYFFYLSLTKSSHMHFAIRPSSPIRTISVSFNGFLIILKPQSNHNATVATRFICISILSLKLPIVIIISLVYMHIRPIAQYYSPKIHFERQSIRKSSRKKETSQTFSTSSRKGIEERNFQKVKKIR